MIYKPNFIIITLICLIIMVEILFLMPSEVETGDEGPTTNMYSSIETIVQSEQFKDEVGYTIDKFHYTSVQGEVRQWEVIAKQAILYEKSQFVVASDSTIRMYDPLGQVTNIKSDEAKYRLNLKDLDLIGNVVVIFPDGFKVKTTHARYNSGTGAIVSDQPFYGVSDATIPSGAAGEYMEVWGTGFNASRSGPDVLVDHHVHVRVHKNEKSKSEITDVRSDNAKIDRVSRIARFAMNSSSRLVDSMQGTLRVTSRHQEVAYKPESNAVKTMTALDDVKIVETNTGTARRGMKYATAQKAEFLTDDNKILLSGFPSVYQEFDTVTGEQIIIYRNKSLVEVTHANAYHDGSGAPR